MICFESNFAIFSTSSSLCTKPYERLTEFKVPKTQSLSIFEKDYETNKVSSSGLSPIAHGPVSHILSLYPDEVFEPPKPLIRESHPPPHHHHCRRRRRPPAVLSDVSPIVSEA